MKKSKMNPIWQYVIYSYLAFWAIILVFGGMIMVFNAPPIAMTGVEILGAWSPTIVLLLILKKLKPGAKIKDFYKGVFWEKLNIPLFVVTPVIVFGIFLSAAWLSSVMEKTPFMAQLTLPSALVGALLLAPLRGPSGEESGWRGYLRPELEGRYGFMKGNLFLGLVWAFWHAPLWVVAQPYAGLQAVIYVIANIVILTALTFIMSIFMRRCNNLWLAFWIHFCFNLSLLFFAGDVYFFIVMSVLYVVVVAILLRFFYKTMPVA